MDKVTLTLKNINDPLDKIFACLPAGREEFLPDLGAPHASVGHYKFFNED